MYEGVTLAKSSQDDRTTLSPCLMPWFAALFWVQLGLVCCLTAMFVILVLLLHWALPGKKRDGRLAYETSERDFASRNVRPPAAYAKRPTPSFRGSFPRHPPSTFRPSPRHIPLPPGPSPRQLSASPMPPSHHSLDRRLLHHDSPLSLLPQRPLKDALPKSRISNVPVPLSPPPAAPVPSSSPTTHSHLPVALSELPILTTTLDVPSSTSLENTLTTNTTTITTMWHFPPITTADNTLTTTTTSNTNVYDTKELITSTSLQSSTASGFLPIQTTTQIPHPSTLSLARRSHENNNSTSKSAVTLSGTSSSGKDFNVSSASPEDDGSSSLSSLKSHIREMLTRVKEIDARVVQRDEVSVMRLPMRDKVNTEEKVEGKEYV